MPKNTTQRIIDSGRSNGGAIVVSSGGGGGVTAHNLLTGLDADDHLHYLTTGRAGALYVPLARTVTTGAASGLSGGGALSSDLSLSIAATLAGAGLAYASGVMSVNPGEGLEIETDAIGLAASVAGAGLAYSAGVVSVGAGTLITVNANDVALAAGSAQYQVPVTGGSPFTPAYTALSDFALAGLAFSGGGFNVGAGAGITVNANDVALTTPGTLTVSTANNASGSHLHAITSSSDPDATASLLATTAAGLLTLRNGAYRQAAQSYATFASGFAGSGWRVDYGITTASKASAEFDDLTVRGRMRIYELLIQQIRATNGSLFVTSSSKVVSVTTNSNAWTINGAAMTINGVAATLGGAFYTITTAAAGDSDRSLYHGFLVGDMIVAQQVEWDGDEFAGVTVSKLEVTRVDSLTQYGASLVEGDAPVIGFDYVRRGNATDTTRQGAIYLTSDDSAAPFIDIVDGLRYHSDWNTPDKIKVRLGKLTGISDVDFGGPLTGYGLYSQNVYLKGQIVVTGGDLGGLAAADINDNTTTIDGGKITANSVTAAQIAANTITTTQLNFTPVLTGNVVASINASAEGLRIAANKINITADVTFAAGYDPTSKVAAGGAAADINANVTTISGGKITTDSITADKLDVTDLSAVSAKIADWTLASTYLYSSNIGIYSGAAGTARIEVGASSTIAGMLSGASGASIAFWAGSTYSGAGTAPYRVTMDGSFTATKGAVGDIDIADNAIYIAAPTTYSLSTKGYKFKRASDAVLMGGMTDYYSSALGINYIHLDNNITTGAGSAANAIGADTYVRAAASGAGKVARVEASAYYSGTGAKISLSDDGTNKAIALTGNALTYNANTIWHAGNDGTGSALDADLLDGSHASSFALLSGATFSGAVTFSGAINANGTIVLTQQAGVPDFVAGKAIMYLKRNSASSVTLRVRLASEGLTTTEDFAIVSS